MLVSAAPQTETTVAAERKRPICSRKPIRPYYVSPWQEERLDEYCDT